MILYKLKGDANQVSKVLTKVFKRDNVFSCRIYGLRKYKNKIKGDEEIAKKL